MDLSQESNVDSLIYILNGIKISIEHNQNIRIGIEDMANNTKVDMSENYFRSIILIQEIIKNAVHILESVAITKQNDKIDDISSPLDPTDILSECNILLDHLAIDGLEIGGNPNDLKKMLHLLPEM